MCSGIRPTHDWISQAKNDSNTNPPTLLLGVWTSSCQDPSRRAAAPRTLPLWRFGGFSARTRQGGLPPPRTPPLPRYFSGLTRVLYKEKFLVIRGGYSGRSRGEGHLLVEKNWILQLGKGWQDPFGGAATPNHPPPEIFGDFLVLRSDKCPRFVWSCYDKFET